MTTYITFLRGMFTLSTAHPLPTSTLSSFIPPLNLSGRAVARNTTVGMEHVEKPADMTMWPDFHNGVAAGLCLARSSSEVSPDPTHALTHILHTHFLLSHLAPYSLPAPPSLHPPPFL